MTLIEAIGKLLRILRILARLSFSNLGNILIRYFLRYSQIFLLPILG